MQPNNPSQPSDPFAFLNNSAPVGQKPSPLSPNTTKGRVILVSVIFGVILIGFIIFMSVLNSSKNANAAQYLEISQKQAEIIRLSTIAQAKADSLETKSYAATIKLAMTSSQTDINKLVTSHGVNKTQLNKKLTLSKNSQSDAILDEADKNNRFDSTFKELINSQLNNFQKQINEVVSSSTKKEQQVLKNAFDQAGLIQSAPATAKS